MSSGSFYRPVDTPAGKAGWVAEITFWFAPNYKGRKMSNISKIFETQSEADEFVGRELYRLFHSQTYRFRNYADRMKPVSINQSPNQTHQEFCQERTPLHLVNL